MFNLIFYIHLESFYQIALILRGNFNKFHTLGLRNMVLIQITLKYVKLKRLYRNEIILTLRWIL